MKKITVLLAILLLIFSVSVIAEEDVKVPFSAVKSSCYGQIDMSKAEFSLLDIGKNCVKETWLEENLSQKTAQTEGTQQETKEQNRLVSFERSRSEIFDLLANPSKIEYSLDNAWKYSVTGWERSDLSSGKARWLTRSGGLYNYELIGKPASKFTFIGGITGEAQNSANFLVRAALVMRAVGVSKDNVGSLLSDLINKAADNPNKKVERRVGDISVNLSFLPSISMLSLTLEAD